MLGTYASALLVMLAAAAVGQAVLALCGRRRWSWLAPAVGLAALLPVAWWSVRLPGEGTAATIVLGAIAIASGAYLYGRVDGLGESARVGLPVAGLALVLASLPFIIEGRYGILGTGLNPDMSQHLFAADRLAESGSERLISSGYPLGPHSLAVALAALGPSLVQAFDGITVATAVVAAVRSLAVLVRLPRARRLVAALLVGFAYMTVAYLTQGAFKETIQALFVLAFAIGLGGLARGRLAGEGPPMAVPLGVIAAGSAYAYSFPGLLWLGGAAAAWATVELALAARHGRWQRARAMAKRALAPAAAALGVALALIAPELGRLVDFADFETFDPAGAGLGNLFNPISPLEALGIWPSGDFRLDPGDGAAPAIVYYAGAAIALAALALGLWWWLRRAERAVPVALGVAALLVLYANLAGTPYQEAKAIALAAPLAMLISVRALAETAPSARKTQQILRRRGIAVLFPGSARVARIRLALAGLAASFTLAAAGCSLVALANGPVGPSSYSPVLTGLRSHLRGSTLVLAPQSLLDAHGRDYLVWELRGGRVCVEPEGLAEPPDGIAQIITVDGLRPPGDVRPATGAAKGSGPYSVWWVRGAQDVAGPCPLISPGARAEVTGGG
jgi:hypothetical protein